MDEMPRMYHASAMLKNSTRATEKGVPLQLIGGDLVVIMYLVL